MKSFSKIYENKDIDDKVREIIKSLNKIRGLEVDIEHTISPSKQILLKIKLKFEGNLKKLSPDALIAILGKVKGYIENIEYIGKEDEMVLEVITFDHLI
jgi:hypothetical protein